MVRRAFVPLVVGVIALVASMPGAPVAALQPAATAACESQHVLLLMDESGSLRRTDPSARRVDAAARLLEALAPTGAQRPSVNLTLAGFSSDARTYGTYFLPRDLAAASSEVQRFRERNTGRNTDYVVALRFAARHFTAVDAPPQCKTFIWFTDGGHDVQFPSEPDSQIGTYTTARDADVVTAQLEGLVCGPLPAGTLLHRSVREEMLSAGFRTVVSELQVGQPTGREQQLVDRAHRVMQRLLTTPGDDCSVPGEWSVLSDTDQLVPSFVARAQQALGATPIDCELLTSGRLRSDVVSSVAFRTQTGSPVVLRVGGQRIDVRGRIIDRDLPPTARAAGAPVRVESPEPLLDCYVRFDAVLRFRSEPVLFRGATASSVELVVSGAEYGTGTSVGPELVRVEARADGEPLDVEFDPERRVWTAAVPTPSSKTVALTARAVAVGTGAAEVEVASLDETIEVSPTPPAPGIAWVGPLEIEGAGTFHGALRVTPKVQVPGARYCVTFPRRTALHGSQRAGNVAQLVTESTEQCGPAEVGSSFDVPSSIEVSRESNGAGRLLVRAAATYVDPSGVRVDVTEDEPTDLGRFLLAKEPDRFRQWLIAVALALAALLVPVALVWSTNRRQAKLLDPRDLRLLKVPVTIVRSKNPRGSTFVLDLAPEARVRLESLEVVEGNRRQWLLPFDIRVTRHRPRNPFGTPSAMVRAGSREIVASAGTPMPDGAVRVAVRIRDFVIVSIDRLPDATDVGLGQALLVVSSGQGPRQLEALLREGLGRCGPSIREPERDGGSFESRPPTGAIAPSTPSPPPSPSSMPPPPPDSRPDSGPDAGAPPPAPPRPDHPSPVRPRPPAPPRS